MFSEGKEECPSCHTCRAMQDIKDGSGYGWSLPDGPLTRSHCVVVECSTTVGSECQLHLCLCVIFPDFVWEFVFWCGWCVGALSFFGGSFCVVAVC